MAVTKTGDAAVYSTPPTGFFPITDAVLSLLAALASCVAGADVDRPELRASIDRCRAELNTLRDTLSHNSF